MNRFATMAAIVMISLAAIPTAPQEFRAALSGEDVVPATGSRAGGQATFGWDGEHVTYRVDVVRLDTVVGARIHLAPAGLNGPVVADLYAHEPATEQEGVIASGTIAPTDLVGPFAGRPMSRLVDAMRSDSTYVNVATVRFPGGEIRGTIHAR